jgi:hypothetical protein
LKTESSKAAPKVAEELKQRKAGKSVLLDRLGSDVNSMPKWYDITPKYCSKPQALKHPWTLSGNEKDTCLPRLVGFFGDDRTIADMGFAIRVSTCFETWEPRDSDYVYFDVYEPTTKKVTIVRCECALFQKGFEYSMSPDFGPYEDKAKKAIEEKVRASKPRDYGDFIAMIEEFIDSYYMVRSLICVHE